MIFSDFEFSECLLWVRQYKTDNAFTVALLDTNLFGENLNVKRETGSGSMFGAIQWTL